MLHFLKGTSSGLAGAHANRELPGLPGVAGSPPPTRAIPIATPDGFLRASRTRATLFYTAFHSRLLGVAVVYFCFLHTLCNVGGNYCTAKEEATAAAAGFPGPWAQGPICGRDPSGVHAVCLLQPRALCCTLWHAVPSPRSAAALGLGISPGNSEHFDLKRFYSLVVERI